MKLLYHGPLWQGSTSLQRAQAFQELSDIQVIANDDGHRVGKSANIIHRIRWKLRWPVDVNHENESLFVAVEQHRPDIIFVDSSKVIRRCTLRNIRALCEARLVYYTPDDIMARHHFSYPLRQTFPDWDVFFTTKTFNVPELKAAKVNNPILVGKSFDPMLHNPMLSIDVGEEFEAFDIVFIGAYEKDRCQSINRLAEAGLRIVLYGSGKGRWSGKSMHPSITLRPSVFAEEYRRCWHHGKVALCFLRKINRDRITQRTMEIAAMARPMLAEKTDEHDDHFVDGKEYIGFRDDDDLVTQARWLLQHDEERTKIGHAGRLRCLNSNYSSLDRARWMLRKILEK
ncbi:CgeB family protein [Methylococcus mesophilus]|uniref:CgeB family protein n=1 Tax=Methylococcus mesophilus TaxID=2993564 RepID=UPI00224B31E2|nr:glycosyltransferase [Methylococcus mesophilus]UZR28731.1 glycosyltransferase [Methylococcus mesophilus]